MINENNKVECNLCGMIFDIRDKDYELRVIRHDEFHIMAQLQKRNTTHGKPVYKVYYD